MPNGPTRARPRAPRVQKLIKKRKASNSRLISTPRVAVRPNAIRRRRAANTFSKPLPRRLPGSFRGLAVSEWSHNVENPFSESVSKIPDLVSGPPSCLMGTIDITNTFSKFTWPASDAVTTYAVPGEGDLPSQSVSYSSTINTVGQQLIVQFLPCVMSPASFLLTPEESKEHYRSEYDNLNLDKLSALITKALEHSADQITPILGYWLVLDANGKVIGVDLLRADKLMTAEESIKLVRLTKAGIRVGLQQPKFSTGGQVYVNRGAGAFLPIFGIPDLNDDGVDGQGYRERLSAFKPGHNCYVNLDEAGSSQGPDGFAGTLATKANMVRLCSKTAGTVMRSLDSGPHSMSMASYPLDSVKALEYMPYDKADSWGIPTHNLIYETIVGADNGTLGKTPGWPSHPQLGLGDAIGYNADRMMTRWCPGWFVFHPTFSTSINPSQIVANLQIETFTAWEFIPYARTFAHLTRTPSHVGDAAHRKVGKPKDSLTGTGGINEAKPAPVKHQGGGVKRGGGTR